MLSVLDVEIILKNDGGRSRIHAPLIVPTRLRHPSLFQQVLGNF
jgi:hypothetical protein